MTWVAGHPIFVSSSLAFSKVWIQFGSLTLHEILCLKKKLKWLQNKLKLESLWVCYCFFLTSLSAFFLLSAIVEVFFVLRVIFSFGKLTDNIFFKLQFPPSLFTCIRDRWRNAVLFIPSVLAKDFFPGHLYPCLHKPSYISQHSSKTLSGRGCARHDVRPRPTKGPLFLFLLLAQG